MRLHRSKGSSNYEIGPGANVLIPALVLLTAGILKTYYLSIMPWGVILRDSKALDVVLIQFEFGVCFLLISGWQPFLVKWVSAALFLAFSLYSCFRVFQGIESCDCFGFVDVSPLQSLLLNLVCIGLLLTNNASIPTQRLGFSMFCYAVAASISVLSITSSKSSQLSAAGEIIGDGSVVLIDNKNWSGARLPLLDFVQGELDFLDGDCNVLIYSEQCSSCRNLVDQVAINGSVTPVVLLCIDCSQENLPDTDNVKWRNLDQGKTWFANVPIWIGLTDGVVTEKH